MAGVRHWAFALAGILVCVTGCGKSGPQLVPVDGTVKYSDGTVPAGEVRTIRFEPTTGEGPVPSRPASGTIQPDGTFKLMTFKPGDGALAGSYKVVLVIFKTYMKHEPVLPSAYSSANTTPLETVTVKAGGSNHFDLVVQPLAVRK